MMLDALTRDGGSSMTNLRWRRLALGLAVGLAPGVPAQQPPSGPCVTPQHREFDFWLGDWDTYDMADTTKVVARLQVTSILGGCVLREAYRQNDGLVGESYSLWDASRRRWHQSWVTNRGALLLLEGGVQGGRMVLTARETGADSATSLLRGSWWAEGPNVRSLAERSTDGGQSWTPVFDIVFRPHRGN
jgi:hypothetical protein